MRIITAGEPEGFKKTLERSSGLTAAQLGMALQLAQAEFKRMLLNTQEVLK